MYIWKLFLQKAFHCTPNIILGFAPTHSVVYLRMQLICVIQSSQECSSGLWVYIKHVIPLSVISDILVSIRDVWDAF